MTWSNSKLIHFFFTNFWRNGGHGAAVEFTAWLEPWSGQWAVVWDGILRACIQRGDLIACITRSWASRPADRINGRQAGTVKPSHPIRSHCIRPNGASSSSISSGRRAVVVKRFISHNQSNVHPSVHAFIHSFIHSFTRWFVRSKRSLPNVNSSISLTATGAIHIRDHSLTAQWHWHSIG